MLLSLRRSRLALLRSVIRAELVNIGRAPKSFSSRTFPRRVGQTNGAMLKFASSVLIVVCSLSSFCQLIEANCNGSYLSKFQDDCGLMDVEPRDGSYILNGRKKDRREFPWTAQISVVLRGSLFLIRGSGTLISDRHVLTAAHVLESNHGISGVYVYLGTDEAKVFDDKDEGWLPVESYCKESVRFRGEEDWAILTLERPVEFDDYVRPACWPDSQDLPTNVCYLAGVGVIDDHNTQSRDYNIMQARRTACLPGYNRPGVACFRGAGLYRMSISCFGDSGGGLVCLDDQSDRWFVHGNLFAGLTFGKPACQMGQMMLVHSNRRKQLEKCHI